MISNVLRFSSPQQLASWLLIGAGYRPAKHDRHATLLRTEGMIPILCGIEASAPCRCPPAKEHLFCCCCCRIRLLSRACSQQLTRAESICAGPPSVCIVAIGGVRALSRIHSPNGLGRIKTPTTLGSLVPALPSPAPPIPSHPIQPYTPTRPGVVLQACIQTEPSANQSSACPSLQNTR